MTDRHNPAEPCNVPAQNGSITFKGLSKLEYVCIEIAKGAAAANSKHTVKTIVKVANGIFDELEKQDD